MWITLCALLLTAQPADKDLAFTLASPRVEVPILNESGHIAVDVMIGDKGPFRFNIDTYASCEMCIDDDLAKELGLESFASMLNSDGKTARTLDVVRVNDLGLGGASFSSVSAVVDDYDWVKSPNGEQVQGLLGFFLFRDLMWTVDYPQRRLLIEVGTLDPESDHVIPYVMPRGAPDVKLVVEGKTIQFGLDTGARAGVYMDLSVADEWKIPEENRKPGTGRSAYNEFEIVEATVPVAIQFAGHELSGVNGVFSKDWPKNLIGYDMLKSFEVTFDHSQRLIRLSRPKPSIEAPNKSEAGDGEAEQG